MIFFSLIFACAKKIAINSTRIPRKMLWLATREGNLGMRSDIFHTIYAIAGDTILNLFFALGATNAITLFAHTRGASKCDPERWSASPGTRGSFFLMLHSNARDVCTFCTHSEQGGIKSHPLGAINFNSLPPGLSQSPCTNCTTKRGRVGRDNKKNCNL